MSTEKTIDISVLPEAEQDLIKALFDKCCERVNQKEEKKSEPKIWKPEYGDWYWYISSDGQVDNCEWVNGPIDLGRYSMGNCFRTKEEARIAREKQKVETELQRYADEHNDLDREEWDGINIHYRIGYDSTNDGLATASSIVIRRMGDIYFTSKEIAEDAANKVGAKRIMKYLFHVDCEEDE